MFFRQLSNLHRRLQSTSITAKPLLPRETPVRKPEGVKWSSPTTWVLAFIPIFTFGLGTWQVQRLKWKVKLIEEIDEKLNRDAVVLPKRINLEALPRFMFRKVLVSGTWDHEHSMFVGPRTREGTLGYHLVTPLRRTDGTTIFVDRGFISRDCAARNPLREYDDEVHLLGLLGMPLSKSIFTPDNHPEKGVWHWMDANAMKEFAGGDKANVQPVLVEELFEGDAASASQMQSHGIPIGRPPEITLRNMHATYVATWYSLSLATSAMFWYLVRKGRSSRSISRR